MSEREKQNLFKPLHMNEGWICKRMMIMMFIAAGYGDEDYRMKGKLLKRQKKPQQVYATQFLK